MAKETIKLSPSSLNLFLEYLRGWGSGVSECRRGRGGRGSGIYRSAYSIVKHKKMRKLYLLAMSLLFISLLGGCASTSMLPQTANDVIFEGGKEGKVGWSSYREEAIFKNADKEQVIQAAKSGLGGAGFALEYVNNAEGVVFGEHGMTLHDWNIIAGVYIKEKENDTLIVILVEGSKDIGFSGDVTGGAWTGKILKGMRDYLEEALYTSSESAPQTISSQPPDVDVQLENSIQDLVSQLSDGLKKHRVAFVAVLPLSDASGSVTTSLGNYLAEKISSGLYSTGDVKVIERSQLTKVVDELEFTMGGMFDDASVKRIGRLLAVDAVVVGSYAELGITTVEVNARVVNVETAEVLGVGAIRIPKVFVQQLL